MTTPPPIIQHIKTIEVLSPVFSHQGFIPVKYTCDGKNINPALNIHKLPQGTKSLVVIVDDPDAPGGTWTHWLVWNVAPTSRIEENSIPGTEGVTDFREQKYSGPCPPSGIHHYHFRIYALNAVLALDPGSSRHEVEKAMKGHIVGFGEIVCLFRRN